MRLKKRIEVKSLERGMVIIDPHNRRGTIETIESQKGWDTFKKEEAIRYRIGLIIEGQEYIEYFHYISDNKVETFA